MSKKYVECCLCTAQAIININGKPYCNNCSEFKISEFVQVRE